MKIQTALALLCACLCCSALSAQHPHAQQALKAEHLRNISKAVQHLPSNQTVAERGNEVKLDSTVTYFYFDTDSIPDQKTVFSEPAADVSIATTYRMFDDWVPESRSTTIVDDLGRTVTIIAQIWDADQNDWIQESMLDVFPRGNSMTLNDSMFVYAWDVDANDWKLGFSIKTSYDALDRPVVSITYFSLDILGEIVLQDELFYDANGDNHLVIQSALEQDTWVPFSRIETVYVQHKPVSQTTFFYLDEVNYMPSNQTTHEYDPNGYLILTSEYEFDFVINDWKNTGTTQYVMDNEGRILTQTIDDLDPQNLKRYRIAYAYFSGQDLFSEANLYWDFDTETWVQTDKTYYYYSNTTAAPIVRAPEKLALSPNPTTGMVNVSLNPQARLSVLDAQGRPVRPDRLGDQFIDLGHLPAGVYYIQVLEEDGQAKTGTIVKQ